MNPNKVTGAALGMYDEKLRFDLSWSKKPAWAVHGRVNGQARDAGAAAANGTNSGAKTPDFAVSAVYPGGYVSAGSGDGDNTAIEEQNLLTVLGVSTVADAIEELHNRINSGNLGGLKLGMYLDLPSLHDGEQTLTWDENCQNLRIVIASFNQYKNEVNTRNHIKFVFKNVPVRKPMRNEWCNEGGYSGNEDWGPVLRPYMEGGFLTGLKTALGHDYFYTVMRNINTANQYSHEGWTAAAFAAEIFIDTEKEVFGENIFSNPAIEADHRQTALYTVGGESWRTKNHNGQPGRWWEASPNHEDPVTFCYVYSDGYNNGMANFDDPTVAHGVVPAFCIQ